MEELLKRNQSKIWIINEQFILWRFLVPSSEQLCKEIQQNRMGFDHFILIQKESMC